MDSQYLSSSRRIRSVFVEARGQHVKLEGAKLTQCIEQLQHGASTLSVCQVCIRSDFLGQRQGLSFDPLATQSREEPGFVESCQVGAGLMFEAGSFCNRTFNIRLRPRDFAFEAVIDEEREGNVDAVQPAQPRRRRISVNLKANTDVSDLLAARKILF